MSNTAVLLAGVASIATHSPRQIATVRAGDLVHPDNWIRRDTGTKEERAALARSYQARPVNLILVTRDNVIREGNRRVAAIVEDTGPDTPVLVCITDEEITAAASVEIMLETDGHTKGLSPYERFVGYGEWLRLNPGATARDLAQKIHCSEATVSKVMALARCIPAVHEAARLGRIGPSDWSVIARSDDQECTLQLKLSGEAKNRDELERSARKPKGDAPAVRASKIKLELTSGVTVTVSGADISLDEAIDAVKEAQKEMTKGRDQGLDAKTLVAVCRDKARNGA